MRRYRREPTPHNSPYYGIWGIASAVVHTHRTWTLSKRKTAVFHQGGRLWQGIRFVSGFPILSGYWSVFYILNAIVLERVGASCTVTPLLVLLNLRISLLVLQDFPQKKKYNRTRWHHHHPTLTTQKKDMHKSKR